MKRRKGAAQYYSGVKKLNRQHGNSINPAIDWTPQSDINDTMSMVYNSNYQKPALETPTTYFAFCSSDEEQKDHRREI